jgi:hypothetical protein
MLFYMKGYVETNGMHSYDPNAIRTAESTNPFQLYVKPIPLIVSKIPTCDGNISQAWFQVECIDPLQRFDGGNLYTCTKVKVHRVHSLIEFITENSGVQADKWRGDSCILSTQLTPSIRYRELFESKECVLLIAGVLLAAVLWKK